MLTTILDGWVGGYVVLEEWKLRLTSAEVEVEAELGNICNICNPYVFDIWAINSSGKKSEFVQLDPIIAPDEIFLE